MVCLHARNLLSDLRRAIGERPPHKRRRKHLSSCGARKRNQILLQEPCMSIFCNGRKEPCGDERCPICSGTFRTRRKARRYRCASKRFAPARCLNNVLQKGELCPYCQQANEPKKFRMAGQHKPGCPRLFAEQSTIVQGMKCMCHD